MSTPVAPAAVSTRPAATPEGWGADFPPPQS